MLNSRVLLPFVETGDTRCDIGHIMDFIAQLKYLRVGY